MYIQRKQIDINDVTFISLTVSLAILWYLRTYKIDKYFRQVEDREIIGIQSFFNLTPTLKIIQLAAIVKPIKAMNNAPEAEINRNSINKLTYIVYGLVLLYLQIIIFLEI